MNQTDVPDFKAVIEKAGGTIINSSLTEENSNTPAEKPAETPVVTENKEQAPEVKTEAPVTTPEAKTEVKTEVKVEEKPAEVPKVETLKSEPKVYKGSEIYKNLNQEFKESYGLSLSEAEEIVSTNYDDENYDERELIQDYLVASEQGITEKEMNVKLRKYDILFKPQAEIDKMIEEGKLTEEQFEEVDAEWEGMLRKGRSYLKSAQDKVRGLLDNFEVEQEINNDTPEVNQELVNLSNQFLSTYNNETIKITDADGKELDAVNYVTDEAGKKLVSEVISDPSSVYKLWMDATGKIDVSKMIRDIHTLRNSAKIHKAIYDQALAKGSANIVKDQNNIAFNSKQQPVITNTSISESARTVFEKINQYSG